MTEPIDRPTELEGVAMLALRLQLDSLSLRVDRGEMTRADAKSLVRCSATEVVRGSPHLETTIKDVLGALLDKFDEAEHSQ